MKKKDLLLSLSVLAVIVVPSIVERLPQAEKWIKPLAVQERQEDEEEEMNPAKFAPWSAEEAELHQKLLEQFMPAQSRRGRAVTAYANGALQGEWKNRGAKNMPGAFKFTEMLDGTDTIYGVTWNHYSGEYNSKSQIFKGTVYNPKSGTKGDDFVSITAHWPNRYRDLIAVKYNGKTRLIAGIENGPLYWTENDGQTWTKSTGLPAAIQSSAAHRMDNNKIYASDGKSVYVSTDGAASFTLFKDFGSAGNAALYAPRYASQNDNNLYLARSGTFYVLAKGAAAFTQQGNYGSTGGKDLRVGGDSRVLYVSENSRWWVSTNSGTNWREKFPKDNWYGKRTDPMSSGHVIGANPADPKWVIGGYAHAVYSNDSLNTQGYSPSDNWGFYQNGTNLPASDYYDRIRFNYHPDFQSSQFFYNSTGDLFSAHSTDGGIFISYGYWKKAVTNANPLVSGWSSDYINITTLGTSCALIYRDNLFTGYKDEKHIIYSTQDQGTASPIAGTSGDLLDFYQSIGGDGPPLNSADGKNVWRWQREGKEVWAPVQMYDASGRMRSAGEMNGLLDAQAKGTFTASTNIGWVQTYIDRAAPASRIWILSTRLDRAVVSNGTVTTTSISKGTNQVAAVTQGKADPKKIWFMQDGKVYKSSNSGDSFDNGVSTPFAKTINGYNTGDIGGGWVLPGDDNWILFAGPSNNSVGAVLSKDGGSTWKDVTGDLPYGPDFQVGGMVGTPDGKYVFAGTDIGPWVFVVSEEKWYPIGEGIGYFNTTAIEYIASTNTVRFGTWGAGVIDFKINDGPVTPFVKVTAPNGGESYSPGQTVNIRWSAYLEDSVKVTLMKDGAVSQELAVLGKSVSSFNWTIPADLALGSYTIRVGQKDLSVKDESDAAFKIEARSLKISSPNGGETILAGSNVQISWTGTADDAVTIEILKNGTLVQTVGSPALSAGKIIWSVPDTLTPGTTYTVRAVSKKYADLADTSDAPFTVEKLLKLAQSHLKVVSVSSEETKSEKGAASNLLDGLSTTIWHTEYSVVQGKYPHEIVFKTDSAVALRALKYLPRQTGSNGTLKEVEVYVSENGTEWTKAGSAEWANDITEKTVLFDKAYTVPYVKLKAISEVSGQDFGSGAEVNLYYVHKEPVPLIFRTDAVKTLMMTGMTGKTVHLNVPSAGVCRIELYTLAGRKIFTENRWLASGLNTVDLSGSGAANQVLLMRILGGGSELRQKIVLQ